MARGRGPSPVSVLLIDDDVDARQMYAEYLRAKGWNVFTAADGRSGIDKAEELSPDLIVLDLMMPRVDGWTVLQRLRGSSFTVLTPILVLTATGDARDEAIRSGCTAYLTKPCPPDVLWLQGAALLGSQFSMRKR